MSKVGDWTQRKTFFITFISSLGHVLSSVFIGFFGIMLGNKLENLIIVEGIRENFAQWFLLLFGFVYLIFGIKKFIQKNHHKHFHFHDDGIVHTHFHSEINSNHKHEHEKEKNKKLTPWVLFTIFVFGPCESLIPLLIYPALKFGIFEAVIIAIIFGIVTISTLMTIVFLGIKGFEFIKFHKIERYQHLIAGIVLILSALATFVGL